MTIHRVQSTDCVHSIAAQYGHSWTTLWNHPDNKALRDSRESPTCLQVGDEVFIPPLNPKHVSLATARSHRFERKEVPHRLKLTFEDEAGDPRADLDYELEVNGKIHKGRTDSDGKLDAPIPPATTKAVLRFYAVDEKRNERYVFEKYDLTVGGLDPARSVRGAQARLKNMGLYRGEVDGELGTSSREALEIFQQNQGLERSGELDATTCAALFDAHER